MLTVDPEQSPGRMVQQNKENCKKRHTQICMRYWSFFRECKLQQKSITSQQLEAGGVRKAKTEEEGEEGDSTGGENQITST